MGDVRERLETIVRKTINAHWHFDRIYAAVTDAILAEFTLIPKATPKPESVSERERKLLAGWHE